MPVPFLHALTARTQSPGAPRVGTRPAPLKGLAGGCRRAQSQTAARPALDSHLCSYTVCGT